MVKPDELGKPDERLREQIRKLELTPQEGKETRMTLHTYSKLYVRLHSVYATFLTETGSAHQTQNITVHKESSQSIATVSMTLKMKF